MEAIFFSETLLYTESLDGTTTAYKNLFLKMYSGSLLRSSPGDQIIQHNFLSGENILKG
jgi:hypothetical protein